MRQRLPELALLLLAGLIVALGVGRVWPIDAKAEFDVAPLEVIGRQVLTAAGAQLGDEAPQTTLQLRDIHERVWQVQLSWYNSGNCAHCYVFVTADGRVRGWRTKLREPSEASTELKDGDTRQVGPVHEEAALRRGWQILRETGVDGDAWQLSSVERTWGDGEWQWKLVWQPTHPDPDGLQDQVRVVLRGDRAEQCTVTVWRPSDPRIGEWVSTVLLANTALLGFFGWLALFRVARRLGTSAISVRQAVRWSAVVLFPFFALTYLDTSWMAQLRWVQHPPLRWAIYAAQVMSSVQLLQTILLVALMSVVMTSFPDLRAQMSEVIDGQLSPVQAMRQTVEALGLILVAGAALILTSLGLVSLTGGHFDLQPDHMQLMAFSKAGLSGYAFSGFLVVALLEEGVHRGFILGWIREYTGRAWLGVLVSAVTYGAFHAGMWFLPPREPWWGGVVVMICVGLVWGYGRLRYGLVPVILAHWVSDLFIVYWPNIALATPREAVVYWGFVLSPLGLWPLSTWLRFRARTLWQAVRHALP